ncbi:MAG: hypothetical protein JXR96_25070 [Deltaproteobacteria bacterium]|nr:hypothetical protein [Deltaproteobacteria bacterium]
MRSYCLSEMCLVLWIASLVAACQSSRTEGAAAQRPEKPAVREGTLWDAVIQLGDTATDERAERRLREAGREGLEVCIKAARAGDERFLFEHVIGMLGCASSGYRLEQERMKILGEPGGGVMVSKADVVPDAAATLAARMLEENPAWQDGLTRSGDLFERKLALASLYRDSGRLRTALDALRAQPDAGMDQVIERIEECIRRQPVEEAQEVAAEAAEALRSAIAGLSAKELRGSLSKAFVEGRDYEMRLEALFSRVKKADGKSDLGALATCLLDGSCRLDRTIPPLQPVDGWCLLVQRGDALIGLRPELAVDLYAALSKREPRGRATLDLGLQLLRVVRDRGLDAALRDRAAERLLADLDAFGEAERSIVASSLVNAGYRVPHRISPQPDKAGWIEAAIRQGDEQARKMIYERVFCRGHEMLGHRLSDLAQVRTARAADLAASYAERCPKFRPAAVAVLIRQQDPRAVPFLESVCDSTARSMHRRDLEQAVSEQGSEAVGAELERLAAQGKPEADRLLTLWKAGRGGAP